MTPLDDRAIPHIVKNFPKLRDLHLDGTKVTPAGVMQLADLHWLDFIALDENIVAVGPDPSTGKTRVERRRLKQVRRRAKLELLVKFREAHTASKQKARAAGIDVPPDQRDPFGVAKNLLEVHIKTYDENGNKRNQ